MHKISPNKILLRDFNIPIRHIYIIMAKSQQNSITNLLTTFNLYQYVFSPRMIGATDLLIDNKQSTLTIVQTYTSKLHF